MSINHPPVANAGVNQTVNEKSTVMLNGIASDPDPADNKLIYSWKQIAGPRVKVTNIKTPNPSFVAPTVSSDRILKFLLTAKDDNGATNNNPAIAMVIVKAAAVQKPSIATAPSNQVKHSDRIDLGSKSKSPCYIQQKNIL
ncbi:MAG: hypothetical protein WCF03_10140 [Nitrososphaeraceae archaeon]